MDRWIDRLGLQASHIAPSNKTPRQEDCYYCSHSWSALPSNKMLLDSPNKSSFEFAFWPVQLPDADRVACGCIKCGPCRIECNLVDLVLALYTGDRAGSGASTGIPRNRLAWWTKHKERETETERLEQKDLTVASTESECHPDGKRVAHGQRQSSGLTSRSSDPSLLAWWATFHCNRSEIKIYMDVEAVDGCSLAVSGWYLGKGTAHCGTAKYSSNSAGGKKAKLNCTRLRVSVGIMLSKS